MKGEGENCDENVYKDIVRRLVTERSLRLLDVVEQMGPQLTDSNLETRQNAVETLSRVIGLVPFDFLNADEISCLIDFFSARFLDHHSLIPFNLQGFKALSQQKALSPVDALAIADSIVNNQHFQVQSLRQPERLAAFQTLRNLFSFHDMAALCLENGGISKSNQFLFGFIQSIDGEKDPRNLLLVFDLAVVVAGTFDLAQLGDELFDVISCYFPIDFTPPPASKQVGPGWDVTADELRSRLRRFFTCNPNFSMQSLPLIVEKLSSSLPASRLEAADALRECAVTYPPSCFRLQILTIWDCLQSEMFSPLATSQQHITDDCRFSSCLSAVVAKLAQDDAIYAEFYRIASAQLDRFVTEQNHRFVKQSARVISAVLRGLLESPEHLEAAGSLINRYLAKYSELLLRVDSSTDRQARLPLVQSIETILATQVPSSPSSILDDSIADNLLSLLLSCATTSTLLETKTGSSSSSSSTTTTEIAISALQSIASLAKWSRVASLRHRALDDILELALSPSSVSCRRHCVATVYSLLRRLEPDLQADCALLERVLARLEEARGNGEEITQACFDLIVAICCGSPSSASVTLELFFRRCSSWHQRSMKNEEKFEFLLTSRAFGAILAIFEHNDSTKTNENGAKMRLLLADSLGSALKERLISHRGLASEPLRQLIALVIDRTYLIELYQSDNKSVTARDFVNILSLSTNKNNIEKEPKYADVYSHIALTLFEELPQLNVDESDERFLLDFCLNLSAFLVKCLGSSDLNAFYLENRAVLETRHWRNLVVACHALFIAGAPSWSSAIDGLVGLMSLEDKNHQAAMELASLFGEMFNVSPDVTGPVDHPRRLIERVSPLRRQALVSRMAPPLADNVRLRRVNVVANLTLLTDLTKIAPSTSKKAILEPIWPSVVEQLSDFPSDRLGQVLSLLSDNLKSLLDSNEASRLLDLLLRAVFAALIEDQDEEENERQALLFTRTKLEVRLACVNLLAKLAGYSGDYPLLLGPLQRRIVGALKPCLGDHKRLVRSAAANAVNRWSCS